MSETTQRIVTALALLALAGVWFTALPPLAFAAGAALLAALCGWEGAAMLRQPAPAWQGLAVGALGWAGGVIGPLSALPALAIAMLSGLIGAAHRPAQLGALFAQAWIAGWAAAAAACVILAHATPAGRDWLLGAVFTVWASDIAAYFGGRALGRRRLCPAISPGKTIEGLIGGMVAAIAVGGGWWIAHGTPAPVALGWALALGVAGVVGDLAISAAKRIVAVKDSGHLLPGHGGVLDRLDALLVALPIGWLLWR